MAQQCVVAQAAIVKAQRRTQQAQPGLFFGLNGCNVQVRCRRDALQHLRGF